MITKKDIVQAADMLRNGKSYTDIAAVIGAHMTLEELAQAIAAAFWSNRIVDDPDAFPDQPEDEQTRIEDVLGVAQRHYRHYKGNLEPNNQHLPMQVSDCPNAIIDQELRKFMDYVKPIEPVN